MTNFIKKSHNFFIGIDLGGKEKKTSGVCILVAKNGDILNKANWCRECEDVRGKDVLKKIRPYLKNTKAIAIDAPLTKGRGKGNFRLYEKFLSTKIFREEKVNPLPPALMAKFCDFARDLKNKLEKKGFVLGINLIEVFPTLTKKLCGENLLKKFHFTTRETENHPFGKLRPFGGPEESPQALEEVMASSPNHHKSALICALLAYLHSDFKTRWLGYKDGFLFLPEMSLWEKLWRQKFYQAWMERDRLKYRHLITNVFDPVRGLAV